MPDTLPDTLIALLARLIAGTPLAFLTQWHLMGMAVLAYLLATGRSAWKQGELRQFLGSLGVVVILVLAVLGFAEAWIWADRHL